MPGTEDRELALEFRVLGPLEVRAGGTMVPVRGWREQAVLAVLLLADGGTVTVDRLVEAVWDDNPPEGAVKAVRNCVSALRRRLPGAAGGGPVIPIQATLAGYRLPLDGARLDARDFQQRADAARRLAAAGQAGQAAAGLRAALDLWCGPALAGTESRIVRHHAARLDEQRMSALEDCLDLELALGRHWHAVAELRPLASEHPLRERIAGQLMVALYRSGRQAEALDVYRELARRLAGDLGLDPAAATTRLHESILRQDPSLDLPTVPKPAQLPLDVPGFAGRAAELACLHSLLPAGISVIAGPAGVGKTALAVRFAHQARDRFPDGQLYANLRGSARCGSPATPGGVLHGFLTALGIPAAAVPAGTDDKAALYRSLLAGKRMLVLLDSARDEAQVRPLLPGGPGCFVIVTSRTTLTGLVAAEGARPLALGAGPGSASCTATAAGRRTRRSSRRPTCPRAGR